MPSAQFSKLMKYLLIEVCLQDKYLFLQGFWVTGGGKGNNDEINAKIHGHRNNNMIEIPVFPLPYKSTAFPKKSAKIKNFNSKLSYFSIYETLLFGIKHFTQARWVPS